MKEHRITSKSKRVRCWFDQKGREWCTYTCGVTEHENCKATINQRTGNTRKS